MAFSLSPEQAQELVPDVTIVRALPASGQKAAFEVFKEKQRLALKIYHPEAQLQRVQREIRALRLIDSPFVVPFVEFHFVVSRHHTVTYSLEEFVDGVELGQWLGQGYRMSEDQAFEFLRNVIEGIAALWGHRLVHRDIKPGNIILRPDGSPVLIDLGIARHLDLSALTRASALRGPCTPPYAAPEQIKNESDLIDCRSDLYALGLVIYECLSGSHPYWLWDDPDFEANINRMLNQDLKPLSGVNPSLFRFIERLLQRPMHKRFPNPIVALEKLTEVKEGGG